MEERDHKDFNQRRERDKLLQRKNHYSHTVYCILHTTYYILYRLEMSQCPLHLERDNIERKEGKGPVNF